MMIYREFGKTNLKVSLLGMGCSSLGGSLYSNITDRESERLLMHALESGVNFFDTAPTYNLGNSEKILGRVFEKRREHVVFATKVGTNLTSSGKLLSRIKPFLKPVRNLMRPFYVPLSRMYKKERRINYSPEFIEKSVEGSLRRLRTDYLDLLQLHHPAASDLEKGDFLETLRTMKQDGKIRSWGVSADSVEDALICLSYPDIESVQIHINLLDQAPVLQLLPLAKQKKISVIARTPLAQGLLSSIQRDVKADHFALDLKVLNARKNRAREYRFLEKPSRTMAQAAFQFLIQTEGITTLIPGYESMRSLEETLGSLDAEPLMQEEMERIRAVNRRISV